MGTADISELVRQLLLILALIIVADKFSGELLGRLGQPPVLGELLIGVALGNLNLFGITLLEPLKTRPMLGGALPNSAPFCCCLKSAWNRTWSSCSKSVGLRS
jgi:hypothetical protein